MSCDCDQYCGPMVKQLVIPIATFDDAATPTTADVVLWLVNPSVLLSCMFAIVLQAQRTSGNAVAFNASTALWQLYPCVPPSAPLLTDPQVLGAVFLNSSGVATARNLPDGYTLLDPTKLAKVTATLAATKTGTGLGTAYAVATWEPTDPRMSRALWADLSTKVDLSIDGGTRRLAAV